MTVVGFNFTKISAHKLSPIKGKINIQNRVSITNVEKAEIPIGKEKQHGVKFFFSYVSKYEPKIGTVDLEGDLLYLGDEKLAKSVLDEWKKNKKIPKNVMGPVLNTVLTKCNLQALVTSKDVNLPPSVPLPKVQIKQ